jgi:hypothetical protein
MVSACPPEVQYGCENFAPEAFRLAGLGLTTIPIRRGSKLPLVRWKPYQRRRPDRRTLGRWHGRDDVGGLAVVHGSASCGLACRDYDDPAAYDRWADAHPGLASSLPTSLSARGPKVYFRLDGELYRRLPGGELIGDHKHYSCVPPTIHPATGMPYRWVIPFAGLPPVLDPVEAGFIPAELEQYPPPSSISNVRTLTQTLVGSGRADFLGGEGEQLLGEIGGVIRDTLPTGYGQRNHCLFRLARRLKATPEFAHAPSGELLPVTRWQPDSGFIYAGLRGCEGIGW